MLFVNHLIKALLCLILSSFLVACKSVGSDSSGPLPKPPLEIIAPDKIIGHNKVTLQLNSNPPQGASILWSQTEGVPVSINNPQSSSINFTAPAVAEVENIEIKVVIDDHGSVSEAKKMLKISPNPKIVIDTNFYDKAIALGFEEDEINVICRQVRPWNGVPSTVSGLTTHCKVDGNDLLVQVTRNLINPPPASTSSAYRVILKKDVTTINLTERELAFNSSREYRTTSPEWVVSEVHKPASPFNKISIGSYSNSIEKLVSHDYDIYDSNRNVVTTSYGSFNNKEFTHGEVWAAVDSSPSASVGHGTIKFENPESDIVLNERISSALLTLYWRTDYGERVKAALKNWE